MALKIVGHDKDFIISPDIIRGWVAPDAQFGDTHHNSFRAALRFSGGPRSHDSSLVTDLRSAGDQISQVTAQLKSSLTLGPSAVTKNIWQRRPGQGSAAASSSDPQPLAENQGHADGTAVASSGGQTSMAVQEWDAPLDSMGCQDSWAAVAGTPEAAVALDTANNFVK